MWKTCTCVLANPADILADARLVWRLATALKIFCYSQVQLVVFLRYTRWVTQVYISRLTLLKRALQPFDGHALTV